jgi:hypothetical protein
MGATGGAVTAYFFQSTECIHTSCCLIFSFLLVFSATFSNISPTNKTDRHDIPEILFKVTLSTIKQTNKQ